MSEPRGFICSSYMISSSSFASFPSVILIMLSSSVICYIAKYIDTAIPDRGPIYDTRG